MSYSDKIDSLDSKKTTTSLRKAVNINLLSQGGYGCVYTPALKCDNNTQSNNDPSNYILKLQVMNNSAENEIFIGKIINKIPRWRHHFAPIESKCDVDIRKIDENLLDNTGSTCRIFKKSDNLVALTIPFIRDGSFTKNVITPKKEKTFPCLVHSYQDLLLSLQLLLKEDIVHYDLKNHNLLYDNVLNKPIIIDFGLSIPFRHVKSIIETRKRKASHTHSKEALKKLKKYFYVFATEYYLWCLEIQFICYLLHNAEDDGLTRDAIEKICTAYVKENKAFQTFSKDFLNSYIEASIDYYSQFIGKTVEYTVFKLIENYRTWDNYSLSVVFIKLLSSVYKQKTNKTIQFFYELLLQNMHPNPDKRLPVETTLKQSKNIFFQNDSVQQLLLLINDTDFDEATVINTINKDIDDINKLINEASIRAK